MANRINAATEATLLEQLQYFITLSGQSKDRLQHVQPLWEALVQQEEGEQTPAASDTRQRLEFRRNLTPEQRWAGRNLLHVLGHLLPMRYQQAGREDRQVLSLAASKTFTQQTPYIFTDSLAVSAMDAAPPKTLTTLQNTMQSPATPFEALLVDAGKVLWSPTFVDETKGMSFIRKHDFLSASWLFPQQMGRRGCIAGVFGAMRNHLQSPGA